jgi:CHAT domain-containing protein/tetratricopeptide (TPR) repeat protein
MSSPGSLRGFRWSVIFLPLCGTWLLAQPVPAEMDPKPQSAPGERREKLQERARLIPEIHKLRAQGKLHDAARVTEKVIVLGTAIFGENHEEVAASLDCLGRIYWDMGRYKEAEPLFLRSLKILEVRMGKDHRYVATSLSNLAELYRATARYQEAERLLQRSLKIYEVTLGKDQPQVATTLNHLGLLYHAMGRYRDAEPLFKRSVRIYEAKLGQDHPLVGTSLHNRALLYHAMGRYQEAELLYQRSLKIREARLPRDHPDLAGSLHNLAGLYQAMGRYQDAEPLCVRSLQALEARLGQDHPDVAYLVINLAELYRALGRYKDAEPLYQRGLKIRETKLGKDHPRVANALNNLGNLYQDTRRYEEAESLYRRSLKIREARLGQDHPDVANSLNSLASLYQEVGRFADADQLFQRGLKIREARLGQDHPDVAVSLYNLAELYRAMGRSQDAAPLGANALRLVEEHLRRTRPILAERQLLTMIHANRFFLDNYLSLGAGECVDPADAYARVLAWKGQAFLQERQLQLARRMHQGGDPETMGLYERLEQASRRLATLALASPPLGKTFSTENLKARQAKLAEASQEVEGLKQQLAFRSQAFRRADASDRLTPATLAASLPDGAVLVDFFEYRHRTLPSARKGRKHFEQRLLAFVIQPAGKVERAELGAIEPVRAAVDEWRKSFGQGPAGQQSGARLRQLVWAPLERKVQNPRLLLVSPDGPLGRFPLGALPGKKAGSYLLEEQALTVIAVPQLLPELLAARPDKGDSPSLLAVGDVAYGAEPGQAGQLASSRAGARVAALSNWKALPATRREILAVRDSFAKRYSAGQVKLLRGSAATEQAFRQDASKYRWLHLATHGFFAPATLRSALRPAENKAGPGDAFAGRGVAGFHPGLLSGLVLAGANRPAEPDQDDGILTAVEVATLDMSNVEMAVLSACETGLGETAGGEGLLGLQRAFQVAGARSVIATLWQVDDNATQALMERFYNNLWAKKLSRVEALREAQLWLLPEGRKSVRGLDLEKIMPAKGGPVDERLPPFFWAAFVISGDWR